MGRDPLVVVKNLHTFLCCPDINLPADVFIWYGVPAAVCCDQVIRLDRFRGPYGCLIRRGWKRQEKGLFFFLECGEPAAFPLLKWTVVELVQCYIDVLIQFLKGKELTLRRDTAIQVDRTPTVPSTEALSFGETGLAGTMAVP